MTCRRRYVGAVWRSVKAACTRILILVTVPVGLRLRGGWERPMSAMLMGGPPPRALDCLRVRVEHLPPGVRMDVEFRGRSIPKERRP